MSNRIKAKTNILFLILAVILVAGTITTATFHSSPLSFMKEVHAALSEYKKDNVKCTNFNLNINGLNDVNANPESIGALTAQALTEEAEESQIGGTDISSSSSSEFGNDENRFSSYNYDNDVNSEKKKDFAFVCINNNDNEQNTPPSPPTPPTLPPTEDFLDLATANLGADVSNLRQW